MAGNAYEESKSVTYCRAWSCKQGKQMLKIAVSTSPGKDYSMVGFSPEFRRQFTLGNLHTQIPQPLDQAFLRLVMNAGHAQTSSRLDVGEDIVYIDGLIGLHLCAPQRL
jgi:hypothetical protein